MRYDQGGTTWHDVALAAFTNAEKDAVDLDAITNKWLPMCGPCDGGLPMGCTHPDEDYRPVMASLVSEIERLRARVTPPGEPGLGR